MKEAIIYVRVSTKGQAEQGSGPDGFSIPAQRQACRRRAADLGAEISGEFVDRGISARSTQRPGLQALLQEIKRHSVDYVIVHKLDRLSRNLNDHVAICLAIRRAGAQLVSVMENVDETPTGRLVNGVLASLNEFFSGNLAAEALKGATEKARQGGTPYRAPLGYRNVIHRTGGREHRLVELDPERSALVRWAFTAYAAGHYTSVTLAAELNARGLHMSRSRRPIRPDTVRTMMRSRYYLGLVQYRVRSTRVIIRHSLVPKSLPPSS